MEMNAANVDRHNFSPEAKFRGQKKLMKKADSVSYPQKKYKNLWTRPSTKQQKKPQSSG